MGVGELVAAEKVQTLLVADEPEQVASADLGRGGDEIAAVLGERRVAQIADAVEQPERIVAGGSRYTAET
ncbi:MAG: hypothetical protein EHM50_10040 [Lysobacterales bacterium]|nr:MAG: hypothetical protein EHM50_10040 [Xanthomonadales bacterium]